MKFEPAATSTPQPAPFEIATLAPGHLVASNGTATLSVLGDGGRLFRRRGMAGLAAQPPAEAILPHLNQFAGELLAQPDMPAAAVATHLRALAAMLHTEEPRRLEWAVAELDGVRVYSDGTAVVVTKQDLMP